MWGLGLTGATRQWVLASAVVFVGGLGIMAASSFAAYEDAPDPGGHERAIVPVPAPGKRYLGIHEPTILGSSYQSWKPTDIARIADNAGMEILRFTIDWTVVEPQRDGWDEGQWARYEAAYDALIGRGIQPLITVSTAPPWARDIGVPTLCPRIRPCEYPPRPSMLDEWAEFTAEVARRFPRTAAIEIWNEPNLSLFWKPEPQPERYAALVASAYDAIKAQNPRIKVLAGALAGAPISRRDPLRVTMSLREFLQRAYNARPSIAGHMDGISFHQAVQSIHYGEGSRLALGFRWIRETRAAMDPRRTPIWITEFGLSTSDGPRVTPKVQADALLRVYRRVITMKDVRGFVIHTLAGTPTSERSRGVGIIESFDPFIPKPAYCAFAGRRRHHSPASGCRRIRESRVSRCSRTLVNLSRAIHVAPPRRARELRSRYRARALECVPCDGKIASLKRAVARTPRNRASSIRHRLAQQRRECAPCTSSLQRLERRYIRAIPTLRLNLLIRYDRVRRHCR